MRSYGACNQSDQVRRAPSSYSTKNMLLFVVSALIVASTIITIVAYRRDRSTELLLSEKQLHSVLPKLAQSDSGEGASEPTDADAEPFQKSAKALLAKIKLGDISKTDLESSCQSSLYPCVDQILSCVDSKLVPTAEGKITPGITVCNCFSRGFVEGVLIPNKPDIKFACSYECVGSILRQAQSYVSETNGPSGDSLSCQAVIENLNSQTFGNTNGYIPSDNDAEAMEMMPIDDPKVVRAAEALRLSFNSQRRLECPARREIAQPGTIKYAKRGIVVDGYGQYKLEVTFGSDVVFARISHLPKSKQLTDPAAQTALDDPKNLDGRFVLLSSVPKPCENGVAEQLAVTATAVEAINKQNLPWKAALKEEYEGKPHKHFAHGYTRMSKEAMNKYHMQLDTTDFTPPEAYDERDVYEGQTPCQAFEVLSQGNCGSCYAFASASAFSARLCRANRNSVGNVVVSPQQLMDCNNGCGGGAPIYVYETLTKTPTVESWCNPYTSVKDACGSNICGNGNQYLAQPNSPRNVGGVLSDASTVLQMQLELLRSGPGVVAFVIMSDLGSYSSGVYVVSEGATKLGLHAVVLLGWGVEAGVPYWILQNSWGKGWGDKGFIRMRRGTNECLIEGEEGMIVAKPVTPTVCPASTCAPGSVTLKDCTCRCDNPSMTGPTCSECTLQCHNGGVRDGGCTRCTCPPGYFGPQCEGGYSFSPLASCAETPAPITITYSFGGSVAAPTQASYIGVFTLTQSKHDSMSFVCGSKYDGAVNGGLCPSAGSFTIAPPAAAGEYRIAVIPWQPLNAFGQQGYLSVRERDVIALYTVLDKAACSAAELSVAQTTNDPAARLRGQVAAEDRDRTAQLAAMKLRLDVAKPLLTTLAAELPASLGITGVDGTRPIVWFGVPYELCYRLEPSVNVNPKRLVLVVDDGAGSYYGNALGSGDGILPTTYQGCLQFSMATWLPSTQTRFFIEMRDKERNTYLVRTKVFESYSAKVNFEFVFDYPTYVSIKTTWRIPAAVASPRDVIKIHNSKGTVVTWFYTSTLSQTTPSDTATGKTLGSLNVKIFKLNAVPGGNKVMFYPGGRDVVAAVGKEWIAWSRYGL